MKYLLYVILVALITMLLIYVGYIKESTLPDELVNDLYRKSKKKITDYLSKNKSASIPELQDLIKNIKGRVFWSSKQVKVNDPEKFVNFIVDDLYKNGLISIKYEGNRKIVTLKKDTN
ncbi:hypothetical protein [Caldanaerobacter subterraneus]|uniref:Uncharacterized protein n=1 Tax=Caldanaerobacter subterraneus TaxID=911092 RepID=A0A4V2S8H1_9THEO|nr:hypothetical protein [Caldanaerobacter subterraneus]TCO63910.1 hypothetical protein EV203_11369 [Caldanaerobacter subterraneus]